MNRPTIGNPGFACAPAASGVDADPRWVGDPVDVVTGAMTDETVDFRLVGPFDIVFRRSYSSARHREDRGLGPGHRHGFDEELVFDLDGIRYDDFRGESETFPFLFRDGESASSRGTTLTRVHGALYTIARRGEPLREFRVEPRKLRHPLSALRTPEGVVLFTHDAPYDPAYDGGALLRSARYRLVAITTVDGRTLDVHWQGARIEAVTVRDRAFGGGNQTTLVSYGYDERGRLAYGVDAYRNRFSFEYDDDGRMTVLRDRRGYAFLYTYDALGRCTRSAGEDGTLEVRLEYKPHERTTVVTHADGGTYTYFYDEAGTVIQILDPRGGVEVYRTGDDGRVVGRIDPNGQETTFEYDAAGAMIAKRDPTGVRHELGEDPTHRRHPVPSKPREWMFGSFGAAEYGLPPTTLAAWLPPAAVPSLTFAIDAEAGRARVIRDAAGLLIREEKQGRARRYAYDENGNTRTVVDYDGAITRRDIASWNHVVGVVDPNGALTTREFGTHDRLTSVTDPGGTKSEYRYDTTGQLVAVWRDGRPKEIYRYDPGGRFVEKRDGKGQVLVAYEHDAAGRITKKKLTSGDTHEVVYDDEGRPIALSNGAGTLRFSYDAEGRRVRDERDKLGVRHWFFRGELETTTVLRRFRTRYANKAGTRTIIDPTGAHHHLTSLGHGLFVRELPGGRAETSQFDPEGRCIARVVSDRTTSNAPWARVYELSGEGDVKAEHDSVRGTRRYGYDQAHRVVADTRWDGVQERLAYDAAGNLVEKHGLTGVALAGGNKLARANASTFVYDRRENLSERVLPSGACVRFHRDSRDELVAVDTARGRVQYTYDALSRRTSKRDGDGVTTYFWDTDRLAAEELPDKRLRVYVYADARALVPLLFVEYTSRDADPKRGRVYHVLANHLGAPVEVLDATGHTVWRAWYEAYGRCVVEVGHGFHQPLRWPGHYFDGETGLHCNRFRYYSPELGRYLESDPLGLAGGLNVYAYAGGNPVRRVDVRGLDCPDCEADAKKNKGDEEGRPDQEGVPKEGGDPNAPARGHDEVGSDGLTAAQRKHFRERIENASSPEEENQARYDRNCAKRANQGEDPLPPGTWVQQKNQVEANSGRGRGDEAAALNDLGVKSNNAEGAETYDRPGGGKTRPDGTTDSAVVEVKSVPDTADPDGGPRVVYNTEQMNAQRNGAQADDKNHVVVISNGNPDNCRPSGPLADPERGSTVLHRNNQTGQWSKWNPESGGWDNISPQDAKTIAGTG
jgi:RHS repeat-associated protein